VYTKIMSGFVKAQEAAAPKSTWGSYLAIVYAALLVILSVAQLFSFETFSSVILSYWLPVSQPATHLIAALIVTVEVFSIPFLLRMKLSVAMRWFSMFLGWLAAAWWLFISLWMLLTTNAITNSGVLGTAIPLKPGWWLLILSGLMVALAIKAAWGLWPARHGKLSAKLKK